MNIMKRLSFVLCLLPLSVFATESWRHGERVPLWPEGKIPDFQAHQIGAMTDELKDKDFDRAKRTMPYLEWFEAPTNSNGGCMILVSGGSYECCCDVGLIRLWKETFTKLGYQTVNLVYRTPRAKDAAFYRSGWQDGQRAVRLVRADAKKRGFDPEKIGVIGMSAGGHLVTMLATSALTPSYEKVDALDETPCHVNWCIANAPAYNSEVAAKGGVAAPQDGTTKPASGVADCFKFDAKTCPISLHHGSADPYTPNGSARCYRELRKRKIPAEVHFYADRGHGAFGLERAVEFMNQMQFASKLAPEEDLMKRYPSDDARASIEREDVWPAGKMPNALTNQCLPYLEWHLPKEVKTKAIQIIYSGGGYMGNGPDGFEVAPMRRFLNEHGMAVVTMRYRCPNKDRAEKHLRPWQDLQRTIRIVRSEAAEKGLDPDRIGIMGSSAGGHLTLMGVTSSRQRAYAPIDEIDSLRCNVQWAVPIYPAYALTDGLDVCNTTGGNDDSAVLAPEFLFDMDTCPACFIHGDADGWASMNSIKVWEQMRRMNVQSDVHTLALRGHCFQRVASPGTGSYTWMEQVWDFLSRKGFNK